MSTHSKSNTKHIVLRTVLIVFISLVLGFSVYSWNAGRLVGNKLPMPFGVGMSVVLSGSMEPELYIDDLVLLKECDSYKKGDIVVYQSGDILVIHRIIETEENTVTTKGDANDIADEPIGVNDIKGKLIEKIPYAGYVVRKLKSPIGIIMLLLAAVILIEISWQKEKQNGSDELEKIKEEIEKLKSESE